MSSNTTTPKLLVLVTVAHLGTVHYYHRAKLTRDHERSEVLVKQALMVHSLQKQIKQYQDLLFEQIEFARFDRKGRLLRWNVTVLHFCSTTIGLLLCLRCVGLFSVLVNKQ